MAEWMPDEPTIGCSDCGLEIYEDEAEEAFEEMVPYKGDYIPLVVMVCESCARRRKSDE